MSTRLDELQARLGYTFSNTDVLKHALVHSSATEKRGKSNERLEFLGDRVLGLALAEMLLEAYPDEEEGEIGYRFTALAQRDALARVADNVGIADDLRLSNGEDMTGGRENPGVLADAMEAILAAVHQDGGYDAARTVIRAHWTDLMREYRKPPKDAKTTLQEWAQARGLGLPSYETMGRDGPDHQPVFTVKVTLKSQEPAMGSGPSKRAAEQNAAEAMLVAIGADT